MKTELPHLMNSGRIPGMAMAAIENGRPTWIETLGVMNTETGRAVTPDTIFQAASLSKPIFAYLCAKLVDDGTLDLDRSLAEVLPEARAHHDARYRTITARMVLSHRTGLPNWSDGKLDLQFDPGTAFGYSGEGYVYLAKVIEQLTGQGIEALLAEKVFGPLGLEASAFSWREAYETLLSDGHDGSGRVAPRQQPEPVNVASTLFTNAREYARFMVAVMTGEGLSPQSHAEMLRHQGSVSADGPMREAIERSVGWALGWGVFRTRTGPIYWHWGDNGIYKAFTIWRAQKGFVYFANSVEGLSIMAHLAENFAPEISGFLDFLGYERHDKPGRGHRLDGERAIAEKRYTEAATAFREAKRADPANRQLDQYILWTADLVNREKRPITVPDEELKAFAGQYGPCRLSFQEGVLTYRQQDHPAFAMIPLGDRVFALDGKFAIRLRIEANREGRPIALLGLHISGESDLIPRDAGAAPR